MRRSRSKPNMPKRNLERAGWVDRCLRLFGKITGCNPDTEGWETTISDFLADLRHLCDREKVDFRLTMDHGLDHYLAEIACCECGKRLKAGDDAAEVDCACRKCIEKLDKIQKKTKKEGAKS